MNIKALIKVLATWVIIIVLVIAYLIDERTLAVAIGLCAVILFSCFLYALYSGKIENDGRRGNLIIINKEMPKSERPNPKPSRLDKRRGCNGNEKYN